MAVADGSTDSVSTIIAKVLTQHDPWWWLGALLIVVGLPAFFWKLPETIKALSSYHDQHRKTSHKIKTDILKLERAMSARPTAGKGKKP